eukprot:3532733-Prymnesium_polylepis.2
MRWHLNFPPHAKQLSPWACIVDRPVQERRRRLRREGERVLGAKRVVRHRDVATVSRRARMQSDNTASIRPREILRSQEVDTVRVQVPAQVEEGDRDGLQRDDAQPRVQTVHLNRRVANVCAQIQRNAVLASLAKTILLA